MGKWLNLFVGGVAGTAARYALSGAVARVAGAQFPYGTLIVNVIGCGVAGLLAALSEQKLLISPQARLIRIVGFCAAFTTFSAFMLETSTLLRGGQAVGAVLNVAISLIGGFVAFQIGILLAGLL